MFVHFQVRILLDVPHFCLTSCVVEFALFVFTYLSIHVSTDDRHVVFGKATGKGRQLVIEGDEVRFISSIGRTVARDGCCVGLAVKCGYHNSNKN